MNTIKKIYREIEKKANIVIVVKKESNYNTIGVFLIKIYTYIRVYNNK